MARSLCNPVKPCRQRVDTIYVESAGGVNKIFSECMRRRRSVEDKGFYFRYNNKKLINENILICCCIEIL